MSVMVLLYFITVDRSTRLQTDGDVRGFEELLSEPL